MSDISKDTSCQSEIVSLADQIYLGNYGDLSSLFGDALDLLTQLSMESQFAIDKKEDLSDDELEEAHSAIAAETAEMFYCELVPELFDVLYLGDNPESKHRIVNPDDLENFMVIGLSDVFMFYEDDQPVAVGAVDFDDDGAATLSFYVDDDVVDRLGLSVEDVREIVEELFDNATERLDPDSEDYEFCTPPFVIPSEQEPYFEKMVEKFGWEKAPENEQAAGYIMYN